MYRYVLGRISERPAIMSTYSSVLIPAFDSTHVVNILTLPEVVRVLTMEMSGLHAVIEISLESSIHLKVL